MWMRKLVTARIEMTPILDGDILVYECAFGGEMDDNCVNFDLVAQIVDNKINNICAIVEATSPPVIYLTGKGNFRFDIAKTQPYKVRTGAKPFHYKNVIAYLRGQYGAIVVNGMEADDAMAIHQTSSQSPTIICTRDKDLRQVPGMHYGWGVGNQPSFGPEEVVNPGYLKLEDGKLKGVGDMFFYAQCLMGDATDSIPGVGNKTGPVKAYKVLEGATTSLEAFDRVRDMYQEVHGENGDERLLEQGRLLHMVRELDTEGKPVMWEFPNER